MASGKAGRLAGTPSAAESRPACLSDSSSVLSHTQQAAAQVYPATMLKAFYKRPKG